MSDAPAPTLRPLSVADLIDEIFRLYRRNFALLFGLTAVIWLPASVLFSIGFASVGRASARLAGTGALDLDTGVAVLVVGAVIGFVTFPLLLGATTEATAKRYLDRPTTVGTSVRAGVRAFWRIVAGYLAIVFVGLAAAALLALLAIVSGSVLGGAGGVLIAVVLVLGAAVALVWVAVTWAFLPQAVVVEEAGVLQALRRSAHLVDGARWRVIGINVLLGLIGAVLFSIPSAFLTLALEPLPLPGNAGSAVAQVVAALAQAVYYPVQLGTMTLLYFDLRVRREGFDLALAAERLRGA